eukprot:gnl/MRDRNA2_/MRDRNA2_37288_c0_seq1.p1 gnl/MRDRNA2_/MRDRNA2_37288_c0~~gnl/MRDRNA2_/MRDRNA2_37288_c0_seq1.p1  ORF type:complete len:260 (+),score=56.57 gnl/MRDRNA2_/MRDRNA2_37288_c0_seq1:1-780(+)
MPSNSPMPGRFQGNGAGRSSLLMPPDLHRECPPQTMRSSRESMGASASKTSAVAGSAPKPPEDGKTKPSNSQQGSSSSSQVLPMTSESPEDVTDKKVKARSSSHEGDFSKKPKKKYSSDGGEAGKGNSPTHRYTEPVKLIPKEDEEDMPVGKVKAIKTETEESKGDSSPKRSTEKGDVQKDKGESSKAKPSQFKRTLKRSQTQPESQVTESMNKGRSSSISQEKFESNHSGAPSSGHRLWLTDVVPNAAGAMGQVLCCK